MRVDEIEGIISETGVNEMGMIHLENKVRFLRLRIN